MSKNLTIQFADVLHTVGTILRGVFSVSPNTVFALRPVIIRYRRF